MWHNRHNTLSVQSDLLRNGSRLRCYYAIQSLRTAGCCHCCPLQKKRQKKRPSLVGPSFHGSLPHLLSHSQTTDRQNGIIEILPLCGSASIQPSCQVNQGGELLQQLRQPFLQRHSWRRDRTFATSSLQRLLLGLNVVAQLRQRCNSVLQRESADQNKSELPDQMNELTKEKSICTKDLWWFILRLRSDNLRICRICQTCETVNQESVNNESEYESEYEICVIFTDATHHNLVTGHRATRIRSHKG